MQETKTRYTTTQKLITRALGEAMDYREYTDYVGTLVRLKQTSGAVQSEGLVHYTLLNQQRMRRWEKKITLDSTQKSILDNLRTPQIWLVLTESWCGDAAPVLPALQAIAMAAPNLDLKIALRDEHSELLDRFLTDNARSIPKLLVLNPEKDLRVENTWGPRPEMARNMVLDYKQRHGKLDDEFRETLQKWYNKDKGRSIMAELTALLPLE
jgi:hypothetical protein